MKLIDLALPGDKIDIQLMQQLEVEELGEKGEVAKTYKSRVFDFVSENELEIAMPTEGGRMVLFQTGLMCKMLFYTKRGLYSCQALVKSRYKKDNFFMLTLLLQTDPVKFQRREFFRIECIIDMQYIPISEEVAEMTSTEGIITEIQKQEYAQLGQNGKILDISGGGIRFSTENKVEDGDMLLVIMHLTNGSINQDFYLVTNIIESQRILNRGMESFVNRAKFLFKDLKDREAIVRFVFEEERRIRRKELG